MLKRLTKYLFLFGFLAFFAIGAYAAVFLAIVTPTNPAGWHDESTRGASVDFVEGPGAPPAGMGSVEFRIGKKARRLGGTAELRLGSDWNGLSLRDLGIQYSTYVESRWHCRGKWGRRHTAAAVSIAIDVDTNDDGIADDTLVFDPARNGKVECATWQSWPATAGIWYSINDAATGGTFAPPGRPLAHYLLEYPQAKLVQEAEVVDGEIVSVNYGIGLVAGLGYKSWAGFRGYADGLSISDTRENCQCFGDEIACLPGVSGFYDFEPDAL